MISFAMRCWMPALLLVLGWAGSAQGQVWIDERELGGRLPSWVDPAYVRPTPTPVVIDRSPDYRRVWVEPVYRVLCKRIWAEPVMRVEYIRVWVLPQYEWHETVCWEGGVKVIRREHVCVAPGRWENQRRETVLVPGGWKTVEERELISGGYWKLVPA